MFLMIQGNNVNSNDIYNVYHYNVYGWVFYIMFIILMMTKVSIMMTVDNETMIMSVNSISADSDNIQEHFTVGSDNVDNLHSDNVDNTNWPPYNKILLSWLPNTHRYCGIWPLLNFLWLIKDSSTSTLILLIW